MNAMLHTVPLGQRASHELGPQDSDMPASSNHSMTASSGPAWASLPAAIATPTRKHATARGFTGQEYANSALRTLRKRNARHLGDRE